MQEKQTPSMYDRNFRHLINIAPQRLVKFFEQDWKNSGPNHNQWDIDLLNSDHIETPGDLTDLWRLLQRDMEPTVGIELELTKFLQFVNGANTLWPFISIEDFNNLEISIYFKENYPNLWQSIQVWVFG